LPRGYFWVNKETLIEEEDTLIAGSTTATQVGKFVHLAVYSEAIEEDEDWEEPEDFDIENLSSSEELEIVVVLFKAHGSLEEGYSVPDIKAELEKAKLGTELNAIAGLNALLGERWSVSNPHQVLKAGINGVTLVYTPEDQKHYTFVTHAVSATLKEKPFPWLWVGVGGGGFVVLAVVVVLILTAAQKKKKAAANKEKRREIEDAVDVLTAEHYNAKVKAQKSVDATVASFTKAMESVQRHKASPHDPAAMQEAMNQLKETKKNLDIAKEHVAKHNELKKQAAASAKAKSKVVVEVHEEKEKEKKPAKKK